MSNITKTVVTISGFGTRELDGFDLTPDQVKSTMREQIDLSGYQYTQRTEGTTKYIDFARRTGNKG